MTEKKAERITAVLQKRGFTFGATLCSCSKGIFVVNQTLVFQIKFSAEKT